jgi:hypothetical protein
MIILTAILLAFPANAMKNSPHHDDRVTKCEASLVSISVVLTSHDFLFNYRRDSKTNHHANCIPSNFCSESQMKRSLLAVQGNKFDFIPSVSLPWYGYARLVRETRWNCWSGVFDSACEKLLDADAKVRTK